MEHDLTAFVLIDEPICIDLNLIDLPNEILLMIISYLDIRSCLSFLETSHYIYNFLLELKEQFDEEKRMKYIQFLEESKEELLKTTNKITHVGSNVFSVIATVALAIPVMFLTRGAGMQLIIPAIFGGSKIIGMASLELSKPFITSIGTTMIEKQTCFWSRSWVCSVCSKKLWLRHHCRTCFQVICNDCACYLFDDEMKIKKWECNTCSYIKKYLIETKK